MNFHCCEEAGIARLSFAGRKHCTHEVSNPRIFPSPEDDTSASERWGILAISKSKPV